MISEKKALESVLYSVINNDEEAIKHFKINPETLTRYKRLIKEKYQIEQLDQPNNLKKIRELYSDKELSAIANGGRIIPGKDKVPIIDFDGEYIKFGVISDTHYGSIYSDPEYTDYALDEFDRKDCDFVVHVGDVTEGMSNRAGHVYELSHIGYEKQREHAIEVLSKWKGKMYLISGNHDRWYIKSNGANIVKDIAEKLPDGEFLGHDEGNISLNGMAELRLWHGEDGNSYATSYRIQKVVESFTGGDKPHILVLGHVHKSLYVYDRHIHCVGAGSIQKQSKWMRGKRIAAHTGFWIIEAWINEGVSKFRQMWYPFYV